MVTGMVLHTGRIGQREGVWEGLWVMATLMALAWGLGGCVGPSAHVAPVRSDGTDVVMRGDWDDVGASVQVAAGLCQMAVVASQERENVRDFQLVTTHDEPAQVRFERRADQGDFRAWALVGTFGDRVQEGELLTRIRERLEQLAGRDWAPIEAR